MLIHRYQQAAVFVRVPASKAINRSLCLKETIIEKFCLLRSV